MKKKNVIQLKKARVPHLRVWCNECHTMVKACRKNSKEVPLSRCEKIHALQYRFVAFVPGTKQRIVRSLGRDFNEAVKQVAILKQQLESGNIDVAPKKPSLQPVVNGAPQYMNQAKPELLSHLFGKYLATLKGEGVASHLKLVRSKSHVNDVKNCFRQVILALKAAGCDVSNFRLADLSDTAVGKIHDHLIVKGYSNTVYNRFFSHLTTFATWCEGEEYGNVKRFFERVPRKNVTPSVEIISAKEYEQTLDAISYENGWEHGIGKDKQRRNNFRSYLVSAYRFALTGRRLEEIIMARFSDIHSDASGKPLVIEFTDYKVSRILHAAPGEERKVYSPVTNEISKFLYEQGFEQKRGTNAFIIAPEITHNRVALMKLALTRGFSHFWKVAHPDKSVKTFKVLRKVVMTALKIKMRGDITAVSGHAGEQVLRHYIDEKQVAIADSLRDFSVFGESEESKKQQTKSKLRSIER